MTTLLLAQTPDFAALKLSLDKAAAAFCEAMRREQERLAALLADGFKKVVGAFEKASEGLRKVFGLPPLAHVRRTLWTGIARRHAAHPPTRGYWCHRRQQISTR